MTPTSTLVDISKLIRKYIITSTTKAGSGHPSSSLSAVELMTVLFFGGYLRADLNNPNDKNNDSLIFSKGHAAPLFYSLYTAAGVILEEELMTLREFGSRLEGHPTLKFEHTIAPTGSLGLGIGVGCGVALYNKMNKIKSKVYVLLGDSEMAEGSVYESMAFASYNQLSNLIGIIDVNRLGQRGETMEGHNLNIFQEKCHSFGFETYVIDGHNIEEIKQTYESILDSNNYKPKMIIAKTLKGKGVKLLEDKDNWHGKAIPENELNTALNDIGQMPTAEFVEFVKTLAPKI
jgi:transketolase